MRRRESLKSETFPRHCASIHARYALYYADILHLACLCCEQQQTNTAMPRWLSEKRSDCDERLRELYFKWKMHWNRGKTETKPLVICLALNTPNWQPHCFHPSSCFAFVPSIQFQFHFECSSFRFGLYTVHISSTSSFIAAVAIHSKSNLLPLYIECSAQCRRTVGVYRGKFAKFSIINLTKTIHHSRSFTHSHKRTLTIGLAVEPHSHNDQSETNGTTKRSH